MQTCKLLRKVRCYNYTLEVCKYSSTRKTTKRNSFSTGFPFLFIFFPLMNSQSRQNREKIVKRAFKIFICGGLSNAMVTKFQAPNWIPNALEWYNAY